MAIHVTEQLRTFLLSILLGLGAGVLYDLLRAVRLRHPRLTAPLDLLYCQAVGLAVFLFVLRQSDGQLRGFILLGGLGGGVLFFSLLSRPLRPVWDFCDVAPQRLVFLLDILHLPGILIPFRLRGPDLPLKGIKPPAHCGQKQQDHHMDQQIT